MRRKNISSGTTWEEVVGYSRAVRVGDVIEVSGTTAVSGDSIVGGADISAQTRFILQKIESVLEETGAAMRDVTRTRIYVTDITQWESVGHVHGEFFSEIKPASTMVEVSNLIRPELLVEIEVTAIAGKSS